MKIWTVDAFTQQPFSGNPAAVTFWEAYPDDALCLQIAAEMNLSETAFVKPLGNNHFQIRWFTPAIEVKLCGHATVAAAHTLWAEGIATEGDIRLDSLSGPLKVRKRGDQIQLNFPAQTPSPIEPPKGLLDALGLKHFTAVMQAYDDILVEVGSPDVLNSISPDFHQLNQVECRGVIVTTQGPAPFDFSSRFFAPKVGILEDPVTGSAHCKLTPYWAAKLNKTPLTAYQASKRGGQVHCELKDDRVLLSGHAVRILEGNLTITA